MTPPLRALAAAAALVVPCGQAPAQPATPSAVSAAVDVRDGALVLRLDAVGAQLVVDARALRFSLRPYADPRTGTPAAARRIEITAGSPEYDPPFGPPDPTPTRHSTAIVPLALAEARPQPGMYELLVDAAPGLGKTPNGRDLTTSSSGLTAAVAVWWPDERDGDPGLRDVRARFAGRVVHGYGGIAVRCPAWGEEHGPDAGVRLAAVTRETGTVAMLRTGSLRASGGDAAFRFIAVDPLALQIADPKGVPYRKSAAPGSCDLAWRFADPWHVDTALTTASPPRLTGPGWARLRVGMSRDEVVWRAGYPNEMGTVAAFRAQSVWHYEGAASPWSVTFSGDRVVRYQPPLDLMRLPG